MAIQQNRKLPFKRSMRRSHDFLTNPLVFAVCSALAITAPGEAQAQSYPRKLVRIVVGLTAGGGVDTVSRVLARKMSESTGQQFVIDNRPGAGGNIAFEIVAKAEPDGYTIMNSTTGVVVNPALYKKVPYRIEDFAAVSLIGKAPMILVVHPSLPVHSVAELVKLVKAPTETRPKFSAIGVTVILGIVSPTAIGCAFPTEARAMNSSSAKSVPFSRLIDPSNSMIGLKLNRLRIVLEIFLEIVAKSCHGHPRLGRFFDG